ncbi:MAG: bifunctional hydroxymethylpyrimidine kinase/phosphomethylpyrimidine kinase [Candidatus Omnitrophica bacterium]|nr:bifunctional hydroxymethylpyrimidine kinase/phosphomethylpyrimidine kinase [Candidatus Omnitrophota bacterium]
MSLLVVGSVAYDSVETPFGKRSNVLGGSALFFSLAAGFFCPVNLVAVVGKDFCKKDIDFLKRKKINLNGLEIAEGKTFRWKGRYSADFNNRETIFTHLNVFENFNPILPEQYKKSGYVFLANIDPDLQLKVLKQISKPRLTACDSMNLWIENKRASLMKVLKVIEIFIVNDSEAKQLTGRSNLIKAGNKMLTMGPKMVVIKKGEHGALVFTKQFKFCSAAYPLENVCDPTGSGDAFAGGFMGYLAMKKSLTKSNFKKAVIYGSILASFNVESFSIERLKKLKQAEINKRFREFKELISF